MNALEFVSWAFGFLLVGVGVGFILLGWAAVKSIR